MSSFHAVAARSCASHEGLALALAEELGCDTAGAPETVRGLAAGIPREAPPHRVLRAIARLCTSRFGAPRRDALLLPEVLRAGGGDPVGIAVAAVVIAQSAGSATGLVGGFGRLFVAHHLSEDSLIVDPVKGLIDARSLGFDLHWRCAHESAAEALERATDRAERNGDLASAIAAHALTLALPLEDATRARATAGHRRLLSRLN